MVVLDGPRGAALYQEADALDLAPGAGEMQGHVSVEICAVGLGTAFEKESNAGFVACLTCGVKRELTEGVGVV